MADTTHISWADHTHNHWLGCTKVSNGPLGACEGCYAKVLVEDRFGRAEFGGPGRGVGTRALTSEANRRKPLAWDRKAAKDGTRPFVFCSSLADVFDSDVPPGWRADLFDLIRRTPNLVWLLLTKRPGNIVRLYNESCLASCRWLGEPWPTNAAIGFTAVTQPEMDRDSRHALTAFRTLNPLFLFWSGEPLMQAVAIPDELLALGKRFWAITGGETDQGSHKARPSHPAWFRAICDQCAAASVAYHHKQNGEWAPGECSSRPQVRSQTGAWLMPDGEWHQRPVTPGEAADMHREDEPDVWRLGKFDAGRALDGVIHDARPEVPA